MCKNCIIWSTLLLTMFFGNKSFGQVIRFDSERWDMVGEISEVVMYKGVESLHMKGGFAMLKEVKFLNGIIEFDIAVPDKRGFMGAFWRRESSGNYENFYIRPHQSGNVDANQYNPVFNGSSSWQLYHGEGYGAPVDYVFDEWMHIKIVVAGNRCEVFIMDMETPTVEISALKRHQKAGQIGLSVANYIDAYFANFTFTSLDNPVLKGNFKSESKVEKGTVKFWDVSNTFNEKILNNVKSLTNNEMENLSWDKLEAEETGLINLAKISDIRKDNTVFAKVIITSDKDEIKEFNFGYSDRVKVFLNDELYYSGTNLYRSRDYRYLGTIGYFDSVHLHLKKGKNILIIAITEEYGGWGLQGKFPNSSGIKIR